VIETRLMEKNTWGQMKLQREILKEGRIRSESRSIYLLSVLKS